MSETETEQAPGPEDDELAETVTAMIATEGWRAAADFIERSWDAYVYTRPAVLLAAFKALPAEALMERDGLLVAVDYLRHLVAGTAARRFQSKAFRLGERGGLANRLIKLTGRAAEFRTTGQLDLANHTVREAHRLLAEAPEEQRHELRHTLPHLRMQWALCLEAAGDDAAVVEYQESYDVALLTDQAAIARRAAASLAWIYAAQGRSSLSRQWTETAHGLDLPNDRYDIPLLLAEAMQSIDRLDDAEAEARLRALDDVDQGEYWVAALWVRACRVRTRAEAMLVEDRLAAEVVRRPERMIAEGGNRTYLLTARTLLATAQGRPLTPPSVQDSAIDDVVAAQAHYRAGRRQLVIDSTRRPVMPEQYPRVLAAGLLLRAAAELDARMPGAAALTFLRAHALVEHEQLYTLYGVIGVSHLRELVELAEVELAQPARDLFLRMEDTSDADRLTQLTAREREILTLLTTEKSIPVIAQELFISRNTVKTTVQRIYAKLEVHDRTSAAEIAHRAGLAGRGDGSTTR